MANPAVPPASATLDSSPSATATSKPLPSPPFIPVQGIPNFRTLSSYPSTSHPNHMTRPNFLYRSGLPTHITPAGTSTLSESLKIKTIFDLRSSAELQPQDHALLIPGVQRVHVAVFPDSEWTPEAMAKSWAMYTLPFDEDVGYSPGFLWAYQRIARAGAEGGAYGTVFRHLLERSGGGEEEGAVLVHCTAGKDRTGVLAAIVLKLCGVADEVIAEEYALTEQGLGEVKERIAQHLLGTGGHGGEEGQQRPKRTREQVERMMGSGRENLRAFLRWLDQEEGGAEGYLKTRIGLTEEEVEKLRRTLLVRKEEGREYAELT